MLVNTIAPWGLLGRSVGIAGLLLAIGCGDSGEPEFGSVEECLAESWVIERDCTQCDNGAFYTPECDDSDCREADVLRLGEDGTYIDAKLRWTDSGESASVILGCEAITQGSWSVLDGNLVRARETGGTTAVAMQCTRESLGVGAFTTYARASDLVAASIEAATEDSDCTDAEIVR